MISFQAQLDKMTGRLKDLAHRQILLANADALNKAVSATKTATVGDAYKALNLRKKDVMPRVHLKKASIQRQVAALSVYRKPISAINLAVSFQSRGVKVAKQFYPRAFVGVARLNPNPKANGKMHIFQRQENANRRFVLPRTDPGKRYPIRSIKVHVYGELTKTAEKHRDHHMATTYLKRLEKQLDWRLKEFVK